MRFAALLLFAIAAGTKTSTLVEDVYSVGPGRTRYLDIAMPAEPVRVLCTFEVESPAEAGLRAQLVGDDGNVVAETAVTSHGGLSSRPKRAGQYRLVLDNRLNKHPVRVALYVRLVYGEGPMAPVRRADPGKGQVLVLSSMAVFGVVAFFAGTRIRRNLERKT